MKSLKQSTAEDFPSQFLWSLKYRSQLRQYLIFLITSTSSKACNQTLLWTSFKHHNSLLPPISFYQLLSLCAFYTDSVSAISERIYLMKNSMVPGHIGCTGITYCWTQHSPATSAHALLGSSHLLQCSPHAAHRLRLVIHHCMSLYTQHPTGMEKVKHISSHADNQLNPLKCSCSNLLWSALNTNSF